MPSERVVMIGAGAISNTWFQVLAAEGVEVLAVVDIVPELAVAQTAKHGVSAEIFTDFRDALRKHRPDFVLDLTAPTARLAIAQFALEAGLPVLAEKPMATSMDEARQIVGASEKYGRLYTLGQSRRLDPHADATRLTVASGSIGELNTVNCDCFCSRHLGSYREKVPHPLLTEMGIHHFDLARFLTGAEPVRVFAKEYSPKGSWFAGPVAATCIFEMSDGALFTYRGSWCAEGMETSWNGNWRIVGTLGTVLYEQDRDPVGEIVKPGGDRSGIYWERMPLQCATSPMAHSSQREVLREMLDFLRNGELPQSECHDAIKSLGMMFAAIESSEKGDWVEVNL
jgi:predicted dehydrogenase